MKLRPNSIQRMVCNIFPILAAVGTSGRVLVANFFFVSPICQAALKLFHLDHVKLEGRVEMCWVLFFQVSPKEFRRSLDIELHLCSLVWPEIIQYHRDVEKWGQVVGGCRLMSLPFPKHKSCAKRCRWGRPLITHTSHDPYSP